MTSDTASDESIAKVAAPLEVAGPRYHALLDTLRQAIGAFKTEVSRMPDARHDDWNILMSTFVASVVARFLHAKCTDTSCPGGDAGAGAGAGARAGAGAGADADAGAEAYAVAANALKEVVPLFKQALEHASTCADTDKPLTLKIAIAIQVAGAFGVSALATNTLESAMNVSATAGVSIATQHAVCGRCFPVSLFQALLGPVTDCNDLGYTAEPVPAVAPAPEAAV